jgi:hypothetical protein
VPPEAAVERDATFQELFSARQLKAGHCRCCVEYRTFDSPTTWRTGTTFLVTLPSATFFESDHSTLISIASNEGK